MAATARPGWGRPCRCLCAGPRVGGRAAPGRGRVPPLCRCAEGGRDHTTRRPAVGNQLPTAVHPGARAAPRLSPRHERAAPRNGRRTRRGPPSVRRPGSRSGTRPGRARSVRAAAPAPDRRGAGPSGRVRAARDPAGPRADGRPRAGRPVQARPSRRRGVPRSRGAHRARRDGTGPPRPAAAPRARGVPRPRPARPPRPVAVRRGGSGPRGHERAGRLGDDRRAAARRGLARPCRDHPVVPGEAPAAGRRGGRTRPVRRPSRAGGRAPCPRHLAHAVPGDPGRSPDPVRQPGLRTGVHGVLAGDRVVRAHLGHGGRAPAPGVGGRRPGGVPPGRLGARAPLTLRAACVPRGRARSPRGRRPG